MIYLLLKQHNITGLKYLHKTTRKDHSTYHGSGKDWVPHLEEYGYDYTSNCIFQTEDKETFKHMGIYFSELWNIVESNEWANRAREEGQGGKTIFGPTGLKGPYTEEKRKVLYATRRGKPNCNKGKKLGPRPQTRGIRGPQKNPDNTLWVCERCKKTGKGMSNFTRWHGDKCKYDRPKM